MIKRINYFLINVKFIILTLLLLNLNIYNFSNLVNFPIDSGINPLKLLF